MAPPQEHGISDQSKSGEGIYQKGPGEEQLSGADAIGKEVPGQLFQENLSGIAGRLGAGRFHQEMKSSMNAVKDGGQSMDGVASQG